MLRRSHLLAVLLLAAAATMCAPARPPHRRGKAPAPAAVLFPGLGHLRHIIRTRSPAAQAFFDQGLTFVYAFNFLEAVHSFQRAAGLDPDSPMPWWGIALARGPNFNGTNISPARELLAYRAIQKALSLLPGAPAEEKGYVHALAARFSSDPYAARAPLALAYAQAMASLRRNYPDDPDASTLYAESLMDLHAWRLWMPAGLPAPGTDEIVGVLREVLQRWPNHIGANHYLVHALEASPHPERALASARRLATLAPAVGHLVHMPAHIFMRTGDYAAAVASTEAAAAADDSYLRAKTIRNTGYVEGYAEHNLQFLAVAAAMDGDAKAALAAADKLAGEARVSQVAFRSLRYLVLVRFNRWPRILALPPPPDGADGERLFRLYARGCALAADGHPNQARATLRRMQLAWMRMPHLAPLPHLGAWATMDALALDCLSARTAAASRDTRGALRYWRAAVAIEDAMPYHEPPAWYPVRESLGAELANARDTAAAEAVFRTDLRQHPHNPRSLEGLARALAGQRKVAAARQAQAEFARYWRGPKP